MSETKEPPGSPRWRPRLKLDDVLTVTMIALGIVLMVLLVRREFVSPVQQASAQPAPPKPPTRPEPPLPKDPVTLDGALVKGAATAKLAIIGFSDIECPYCRRFERDVLPELQKKYVDTGKVLFVFRHFPLEQKHPMARPGAERIECADRQGKGWQMHDELFKRAELNAQALSESEHSLGLEMKTFTACLATDGPTQVGADIAAGTALGVSGTPTFFVGRRESDGRFKLVQRVPGAVPMSQWTGFIDRWIAKVDALPTGQELK